MLVKNTRLGAGRIFASICMAASAAYFSSANAQEQDNPGTTSEDGSVALDQVVVTGTRKEGLAPSETMAPVDVLSGSSLTDQSSFDITDALSRIAPSFNTQRFPIADGTAFLRPVTLRNLSPDQTLVLVNGTRRHRSALVNLQLAPLGTINQGAQAVDFQTLPSSAIKRVEVLRDGASAQYGSDAIAGVVNVILKDSRDGASLGIQMGEYGEGDGQRHTVDGNVGLPLGDKGFFNLSFERSSSDKTSRGNPRPDAQAVAAIVGNADTPINGYGQRWGDPRVDADKAFVNAGIRFGDNEQAYSHLSYAEIRTVSDFFYRTPALGADAEIAARGTLQVDANEDFVPDTAPQELIDRIRAEYLDPNDYLTADPNSPTGFVLRNPASNRFPGGYNPTFGADINDMAWVLGAKGLTEAGLSWDIRARTAKNEVEYLLSQSINPSLGRLSPDSFRPGTLIQSENSVNADFVLPLSFDIFASALNLAFGAEYREESYEIRAGDRASRIAGPTAAYFGVGSDGFQGFPTDSAGEFSSESFAGYVDLEANVTEQLSMGLALRVEDYDEFGNTTDGKFSLRFDVNESLAVRGTWSTGFRAPTPGQVNTLNITTTSDSTGALIPNGTYPVDHPVALTLGSTPLDPEESTSYTLGLVFKPLDNVDVTVDYYNIQIDDRIALQTNTISADDVDALRIAGVTDPELLTGTSANFFSNAFDTEVSGVDLSVVTSVEVPVGRIGLDLRHNYNTQEISNVKPGTITQSRAFDLENQVPENRTTLTLSLDGNGPLSGYVRANQYGDWKTSAGLFGPGDGSDVYSYSGKTLVDIELSSTLGDGLSLAIGAENVFDTMPDHEKEPVQRFLGVDYALTSPFGFNGAFYYARVRKDF